MGAVGVENPVGRFIDYSNGRGASFKQVLSGNYYLAHINGDFGVLAVHFRSSSKELMKEVLRYK